MHLWCGECEKSQESATTTTTGNWIKRIAYWIYDTSTCTIDSSADDVMINGKVLQHFFASLIIIKVGFIGIRHRSEFYIQKCSAMIIMMMIVIME